MFDDHQKKIVTSEEANIMSNIDFKYGIISYVWNKHNGKNPQDIIEEILYEAKKQINDLPRFFGWMHYA